MSNRQARETSTITFVSLAVTSSFVLFSAYGSFGGSSEFKILLIILGILLAILGFTYREATIYFEYQERRRRSFRPARYWPLSHWFVWFLRAAPFRFFILLPIVAWLALSNPWGFPNETLSRYYLVLFLWTGLSALAFTILEGVIVLDP